MDMCYVDDGMIQGASGVDEYEYVKNELEK